MKTYAGLDLHGDNVYCAIADETDRRLFEKRFPCEVETIAKSLEPYRDSLQAVIVESTFNWYWLVDGLQERHFPVKLANPCGMVPYRGLKHADDRSDAFLLAKMDRLGILPVGYIYPKAERAIRDLCRRRMRTVQQRATQVVSLGSLLTRETGQQFNANDIYTLTDTALDHLLPNPHVRQAADVMWQHIVFLAQQIGGMERTLLQLVRPTSTYQQLLTVPGIGPILAMTIALEIGEIGRFKSAGDYASYCRTVRSVWTSNDKKKGRGYAKNGNKYLAWAYVEAAHYMTRWCPEAKTYVQRKLDRTGLRVVAIKSLAAKLAKACFFMIRDGAPFEVKKMFG